MIAATGDQAPLATQKSFFSFSTTFVLLLHVSSHWRAFLHLGFFIPRLSLSLALKVHRRRRIPLNLASIELVAATVDTVDDSLYSERRKMHFPTKADASPPDLDAPAWNAEDSDNVSAMDGDSGVKRGLKNRHLSMMALAGIIGPGLLVGAGGALQSGGPASLLIGFGVIGKLLNNSKINCSLQFIP